MITINNATCNTGHLYIGSLTCNEHGHHHDYEINYNLYSVESNVNSLHLRENKPKHMDNTKAYLKVQQKIRVH